MSRFSPGILQINFFLQSKTLIVECDRSFAFSREGCHVGAVAHPVNFNIIRLTHTGYVNGFHLSGGKLSRESQKQEDVAESEHGLKFSCLKIRESEINLPQLFVAIKRTNSDAALNKLSLPNRININPGTPYFFVGIIQQNQMQRIRGN